jgi:hypothetical protein
VLFCIEVGSSYVSDSIFYIYLLNFARKLFCPAMLISKSLVLYASELLAYDPAQHVVLVEPFEERSQFRVSAPHDVELFLYGIDFPA